MTEEPTPRLRTDPSTSARLRRDLEYARLHTVDFDLEAGLRRLGATLDGLESGAALTSRGGGTRWADHARSLATKWWAWSAIGAATLGLVWWTQREAPRQSADLPAHEEGAPQAERAAPAEPLGAHATNEQGGAAFGREGAPRAQTDARRAVRSAEARGGGEPAMRAGSAERTPSAPSVRPQRSRVRARSPSADVPAAAALQSAERGAASGGSATIPQVGPEPRSESPSAVGSAGAAPASALALSDASAPRAGAAPASLSREAERAPEGEVEHLARVRQLLTRDPERALRAARAGQSTFAGGLFHEERAALIVFALARLQRAEEALREAHGYLRAYPSGPFAAPVREIVTRFEDRRR